jgi:hypothetical protein
VAKPDSELAARTAKMKSLSDHRFTFIDHTVMAPNSARAEPMTWRSNLV